jgi:predicted transposase/invertase (TIGR01784 family)
MRKRSRYYQGLLDTPILKSGRETRYKQLPSTVIIFITQEDLFGKDRAKYTFTEQCEEVTGLHLGDGTEKIFLNMTSKNGTPELVSLLQYMKETTLDNPDVVVQDEKMKKLDHIVNEVKQSEEWEAVQMSILSIGIEKGKEEGKAEGKAEDIIELLEDISPIPETLKKRIFQETDLSILKKWHKMAAHVESLEEFENYIQK